MSKLFKFYNHLGFFNPFFINSKEGFKINHNFSETLKSKNDGIEIDYVAIIEILTKGYALADRTIIKGISKSPWMAKPNLDITEWEYFDSPKHDEKLIDIKQVSLTFLELLKTEILNYIGNKKSIGILLTGGMDSRIIAGVLDILIKNKELVGIKVIAYTWGNLNSRDVVYAERIAKLFNWGWKHIPVSSEDLLNNLKETAVRGCEYSPTHLHAMLQIRKEKGIDCILAGSFGDSIGRGEYSGKTLYFLKDLRDGINNRHGIFKYNIIKNHKKEINQDILQYWEKFPQNTKYQQIEQDNQIHYMRRMLNPCLSVINEKIPLYQVFSDPEVFGYIWSLHPKLRNNNIYMELLSLFKTDLTHIPWARTGLLFDETQGSPDSFDKIHHSYSKYLYEDLNEYIKTLVLSKNIEDLNIFNMKALEDIFKYMKSSWYYRDSNLEEKLIWLASLSLFIDMYAIDIKKTEYNTSPFNNIINFLLPFKLKLLNITKKMYRSPFHF
ncbi:asparagine synthase-related protein [Aureibaculum sp. 2210JD6-5]|uniref:asparagine synthase-related protein n=1 Tax=Aureibaculum sp. 2210JD6-5 TaxID=3103957 RepID=UPI002AAE56DA|nr:asparagine synthase-related protein [Aureibaculum sp. 2210JD6-5]MDY7394089.1 asparagine synthase-related protein [Aureibaculum sp. 2210JD6-5]